MVRVYRGGLAPLETLRKGFSWTTDYFTACWFAGRSDLRSLRHSGRGGDCLVIEATVGRRAIADADNERLEDEVVLPNGARDATVSGTPLMWKVGRSVCIERRSGRDEDRLRETLRLPDHS